MHHQPPLGETPTRKPSRAPGPTTEPDWLVGYGGSGHECQTGPDYRWDCRLRREPPHVVLQLTLAGCGYVVREGEPRRLLRRNMAFFERIPGRFEYGWHPGDGGVYELLFVSMKGGLAETILRHVHDRHGHVLDFGDDPSVAAAMRQIVDTLPPEARPDPGVVSARLYALLMTVLSVLSRSRVASVPLADEAMRMIHAQAADPALNVTRLARQLDCSREHLARAFRHATGLTPLDYLTRHRLRLAGELLRRGDGKLEQVARASGFSSAAYLCRMFRRGVGVTPAQYRLRPWLSVP